MGYYTSYSLTVTSSKEDLLRELNGVNKSYGSSRQICIQEEIANDRQCDIIRSLGSHSDCFDEFEDLTNEVLIKRYQRYSPYLWDSIIGEEAIKWYDHDDDMISVSEDFPNYYFVLEGIGEEHGDEWRTIYHNGKIVLHQEIKMYFDEVEEID